MNKDLTSYSYTFPEVITTDEIIADSKIREIMRKFSQDNQRIIVEGPNGCGKTTLLTQFVAENKSTCFSYFFTDNYWNLRPSSFLFSLCCQMAEYLDLSKPNIHEDQEIRIDFEKQKTIFETYLQKIIEHIKNSGEQCYFVIDGLENVYLNKYDNSLIDIIELQTNSRGLFYLGSINGITREKIKFDYVTVEPHFFSLTETSKYLDSLQLLTLQIEKIQKWSDGMPGLLLLAKEMIAQSGKPVDEIINEPQNFEKIINNQWEEIINSDDTKLLDLLSVLAFSIVPLDEQTISNILSIDEKEVIKGFHNIGFIRKNTANNFDFYPDVFRVCVKAKLSYNKTKIILRIIEFYKNHQDTNSRLLLAQYYEINEDYFSLKKLLTPEYLSDFSIVNNDLSLTKVNLANTIELGRKHQDVSILKFGMASAQLQEITNRLVGLSEVYALIELKRFDDALEYAYSSNIIPNRIRLLGRIYWTMEKAGLTIPRKAIDELTAIVNSLNIETMDSETLVNTAADIFPILPDLATQLVDNAKKNNSIHTPSELFALITTVSSDNPKSEALLDKISNETIRDFALTHSPWLSKLTYTDVITKAKSLKFTKAKEYLLRRWCLENPIDPNIAFVLDTVLDEIISDKNYHIPLRNLRQLSDSIKRCEKKDIIRLINRFEIPLFTSLQSPIQEKIRIDLNFIELLFEIDKQESLTRLQKIQDFVCDSELDNDVLCVCLSSLLVTIKRIDPNDNLSLFNCVKTKLEDEFIKLLENSASQFDVTKKVLRSIAKIDVELALTFADLLNTVGRRDIGTYEVLTSYSSSDKQSDFQDIISKTLTRFVDPGLRDKTIQRIVEIKTQSKESIEEKNIDFLIQIISKIIDPIIKTKSLSYILTIPLPSEQAELIYDLLINSWEDIDIAWVRIEVAFDIISCIAEESLTKAQQFFDLTKKMQSTTSLANQNIGFMYLESLRIGSKVFGKLDDSTENEKVKIELMQLIDRIPSTLLRIRILGQISLSLLRNEKKTKAESIIQERIIPGLQKCKNSNLKNSVISDLAIVLYEYSPEEAYSWVSNLPYDISNIAWVKVIYRVLTQSYITDQYDENISILNINLQIANNVVRILNNIDRDDDIYQSVRLICRAISDESSKINEAQKLDLLTKIEAIIEKKLPDKHNIEHNGYFVLCLGEIESAKWKCAKKLKSRISKNHGKIIGLARNINNKADKVLVLAELGSIFQKNLPEVSNKLLDEAFSQINDIHNVNDRIDRLDYLADIFGKTRNTSKAIEAIKIGRTIAETLDGIEKDKILSSIIQTAYQYDKDFASELTEKIEDISTQYKIDIDQKSYNLSKSPQRILSIPHNERTSDILNEAAKRMNKSISSGRNTLITKSTILDWIVNIKNTEFSNCDEVINWAVESLLIQSSKAECQTLSAEILQSLVDCAKLVFLIGSQLSSFSIIPDDLRPGFQGYSITKQFFKANDQEKIKNFIFSWIKENATGNIVICDPYFDAKQLWILQMIPVDIPVKILCTLKGLGYDKSNPSIALSNNTDRKIILELKKKISRDLSASWSETSPQSPPRTMFIMQNSIFEDDDKHDRFILSKSSGLGLGTSLNGFGKKEFFISILSTEDVNYIYNQYIYPKIRLDEIFQDVIFFELE